MLNRAKPAGSPRFRTAMITETAGRVAGPVPGGRAIRGIFTGRPDPGRAPEHPGRRRGIVPGETSPATRHSPEADR